MNDTILAGNPGRTAAAGYQECDRCLMSTEVPGVRFDASGVCNHCGIHDKLDKVYPTGAEGKRRIEAIAARIKEEGRGKKYDCIVGISGGRDTSYCLYETVQLGLRPLAVHFDNGWDSEISKGNLLRLCSAMNVDLHTVIADWEESRELTNCTIRAGVPYIDLTCEVGIARALYDTAVEEGVKYIILSHSYREEGITPLKWMYVDGLYVRSVVQRFGRMNFKKFKNVDLHHMFYWHILKGIRIVNLPNYYDDAGDHVEKLLTDKFGWEDTGAHHFDNEIFALVFHIARHKFGFDWRICEFSGKVRSGVMTKEEAREALKTPPAFETPENVAYCLKKQGISQAEFDDLMRAPPKYFSDYPNYHQFLKLFKYPIKVMGRMNILPSYVYEKFFET